MSTAPWLSIIGIDLSGWEGLSPTAQALAQAADVLVGGERHLAMAPPSAARRESWDSPLSAALDRIEGWRGQAVVVLATGDPMDYGIGATLLRRIPAAEVRVLPAPGAFSLATARMGWPRSSVQCMTVHGRPLDRIRRCLYPGARILALSHDGASPHVIAGMLATSGWGESTLTALVRMGAPDETQITATANAWSTADVGALNTLAIECVAGADAKIFPQTPGLSDGAYQHDGQLTKRVVRAATLAKLEPYPGAQLWDIGAGSGAIAIEWMRAAPGAKAIAIERNLERAARLEENARMLGVPELELVPMAAPEAFRGLDRPDAIFIGGGLSVDGLIGQAWDALALGGRLVANAVTLEGESLLRTAHGAYGGELERISVERAEPVGGFLGWKPAMTVTQWHVRKDALRHVRKGVV